MINIDSLGVEVLTPRGILRSATLNVCSTLLNVCSTLLNIGSAVLNGDFF